MKKSEQRVPFGTEKNLIQPGVEACVNCGCSKGEQHVDGCSQEECPACRCVLIGCSCDCLSLHESARIIHALYLQFMDLDSALLAVAVDEKRETEKTSYLLHAAMQYIFNNVPDTIRAEITQAFQLRFPGLVPALQDEDGQGYYTAEQLSAALDIPLAEVHERIDAMVAAGQGIKFGDGVKLRKVH